MPRVQRGISLTPSLDNLIGYSNNLASVITSIQSSVGLTRAKFSPNGSQQNFTLPSMPAGVVMLSWNGLIQEPTGTPGYTISGVNIHTNFTAASTDTLVAYY